MIRTRALPRWLRSARHRPAAASAILLLSAGAVLVSAVTPMLIGAVDVVTLRDGVARASFPADGVSVTAVAENADLIGEATADVDLVLGEVTLTSDRWGATRQALELQVAGRLSGPGRAEPLRGGFSVLQDDCTGLVVTGRCPASATQALVPASLARTTGWTAGTRLFQQTPSASIAIDVVGTFDDRSGLGRALADPTVLAQTAASRAVPNLVIGQQGLAAFDAPLQLTGAARLVRPIRDRDVPVLERGLAAAERAALEPDPASASTTVRSDLPALLASIRQQQAAAAVLAAPFGLEALVLAWFALAAVAQRTARARAVEWALGRMRGARPSARLAVVFAEPVIAVLVGAVVGFPLAILAARGAAAALLDAPDDVVAISPVVGTAVALAVVGSVVALVAASLRAATLPLPELLQDTAEPRRSSRASLVGQVVIVSLAVAVLWATISSRSIGGQQLGLLLPAMLALVAGLAAVRLAVLLVRRGERRAPRSMTSLVVGRGLARAPSALVAAQIVLVSVALAAGALQLATASATLQTDRARLATGAARVLAVRVPTGTSLVDAVREADPGGRTAMAAEQVGSGESELIAVDSSRLAAVSYWSPAWRRGIDLSTLHPSTGPDLVLRGTRLTVSIAESSQGSIGDLGDTNVQLHAVVETATGWSTVDLGGLRDGTRSGALPCAFGCRLVMLTLSDATGVDIPWTAQLTVTAMRTDEQPSAELAEWLQAGRWRERVVDQFDSTRPVTARTTSDGDGLTILASDSSGPLVAQLEPAVGPAVVPALLGSETDLVPFPGLARALVGDSLSDTPVLVRSAGKPIVLPRTLRAGVMVDLTVARRTTDPALDIATPQVWLAPGEHPKVLAALRRGGVRIVGDTPASDAVAVGLGSATNRAVLVGGVTAVAGLLFGLLALAAVRTIDMPARRREWRTLRFAGVDTQRLRTLALLQMALPAGLGAVVGVVAGSAAASLIVGRLPLLVGVSAGPPLDVLPPVGALLALTAVVLLLVVAVSLVATRAEVRRG